MKITTNEIKQKLEQALPGAAIEVIDESAFHIEHQPTGGHFAVKITWSGFSGKSILEQHQLIYTILREEMKEKIHALRIETKVA